MLTLTWSDGGIASENEYNQFLCDYTPQLMKYMSVEGLEWLKGRMQRVYNNMIESDRI